MPHPPTLMEFLLSYVSTHAPGSRGSSRETLLKIGKSYGGTERGIQRCLTLLVQAGSLVGSATGRYLLPEGERIPSRQKLPPEEVGTQAALLVQQQEEKNPSPQARRSKRSLYQMITLLNFTDQPITPQDLQGALGVKGLVPLGLDPQTGFLDHNNRTVFAVFPAAEACKDPNNEEESEPVVDWSQMLES